MGTYILVIIGFLIVKFIWDSIQQRNKVSKEGGMQKKYATLVELLQEEDSRTQIDQVTSTSLDLSLNTLGGNSYFHLTQTFGALTIEWGLQSPIYGKHKFEWEFDEKANQLIMYEKIKKDLIAYQSRLMGLESQPTDTKDTKKELSRIVEDRLSKMAVKVMQENSALKGDPFAAMIVRNAVITHYTNIKQGFIDGKEKLRLTEVEINDICDRALKNVLGKYFE